LPATREKMDIAAIGLKARTGRAIAVALRGPFEFPQVIHRSELILVDPKVPATFQPYHEVMELPWSDSLRKVKPFIRAIEKVAVKALARLIRELKADGVNVIGVGIVGSQDRELAKIGNYHIRAHAAEGLLFRQALEFAAKASAIKPWVFVERNLMQQAPIALNLSTTMLKQKLALLGRTVGPPWRTEQQLAALAAWLTLNLELVPQAARTRGHTIRRHLN